MACRVPSRLTISQWRWSNMSESKPEGDINVVVIEAPEEIPAENAIEEAISEAVSVEMEREQWRGTLEAAEIRHQAEMETLRADHSRILTEVVADRDLISAQLVEMQAKILELQSQIEEMEAEEVEEAESEEEDAPPEAEPETESEADGEEPEISPVKRETSAPASEAEASREEPPPSEARAKR